MPEVIECPDCQRKLSMREEFLGSQVKCPSCGATFIASLAHRPAPPPPKLPPPTLERARPKIDYDDEDLPRDRGSRRRGRDEDDLRRDDDYDRPRRRRDPYDDDPDYDRVLPDRGAAVLTLGILGLVFSCIPPIGLILGGIALGMGNSDLGQMSRGRMSRVGEGLTQGGKVCGIIALIMSTLFLFFWCMAFNQNNF